MFGISKECNEEQIEEQIEEERNEEYVKKIIIIGLLLISSLLTSFLSVIIICFPEINSALQLPEYPHYHFFSVLSEIGYQLITKILELSSCLLIFSSKHRFLIQNISFITSSLLTGGSISFFLLKCLSQDDVDNVDDAYNADNADDIEDPNDSDNADDPDDSDYIDDPGNADDPDNSNDTDEIVYYLRNRNVLKK